MIYIFVINGRRIAPLLGPLPSVKAARELMPQVKQMAYDRDTYSWFYTFSIGGSNEVKAGLFNRHFEQHIMSWSDAMRARLLAG